MRAPARPMLVLAALVALMSTACVRSERSLAVQSQTGPVAEGDDCLTPLDDAKGTVTLELWHALGAEAKTTLEELAAQFNREQDRVEVQVRSQGTSYGQILQAYIQGIAGGSLPGMAHMDAKDLQVLIDTNTLLPAQQCFDAEGIEPDVIPSVRSASSVDGTYWPALPTISTNVLYYNQSHFRAAGLDPDVAPGTLAELEETARALKASGIDKPLALLLAPGLVEGLVVGTGQEILNNDDGRDGLATESSFDNPVTREVFAWVKRMVDDGLAQPFSTGGIDQFIAVATKTSSMLIETSTASTTIAKFLAGGDVDTGGAEVPSTEVDRDALTPAAGPFPGVDEPGQVQIGGGAFYIPATNPPEVQAAAWAFARFMASAEGQVTWHTQGSFLPIAPEAVENPEITGFWDSGLAGEMLEVASRQLYEVDPERPGPIVGPTADYGAAIEAALGQVAFEGASVDDAVREADARIDDALRRYEEDNGG